MKQKPYLITLFVLLVIFLTGCSRGLTPGLHEIGNPEFANIMAQTGNGGTFVYIGRPTCRYCRRLEPNLEQALQELELPMYYFETAAARRIDENRMLELLEPLDIPGIPIIVYIVNGEVSDYLIGVHSTANIIEFITN